MEWILFNDFWVREVKGRKVLRMIESFIEIENLEEGMVLGKKLSFVLDMVFEDIKIEVFIRFD